MSKYIRTDRDKSPRDLFLRPDEETRRRLGGGAGWGGGEGQAASRLIPRTQ